jgi:polysaccharide export outer membrane protein
VRQAVAVAGGFSLLRARTQAGAPDPADLLRDYQSLSTEYAKEYFHIVRLNAELADRDTFDPNIPQDIGLPAAAVWPIVQAEADSLKTAQSDYRKERQYLEEAVKQTDTQTATLTKQQEEEQKGIAADEEELARVNKLLTTGNTVTTRVSEARRFLALSTARRLQTSAELGRVQRQHDDFARQIERGASLRTINLLRELKESNVRLADLRVRMQALSQKLQPVAGGATALPIGTDSLKPEVTVMRKTNQTWEKIAATEDFDIQPGDVINVALRPATN